MGIGLPGSRLSRPHKTGLEHMCMEPKWRLAVVVPYLASELSLFYHKVVPSMKCRTSTIIIIIIFLSNVLPIRMK